MKLALLFVLFYIGDIANSNRTMVENRVKHMNLRGYIHNNGSVIKISKPGWKFASHSVCAHGNSNMLMDDPLIFLKVA